MIKRVYTDYVHDILDSIDDIEDFIKGMDFNDFKGDKKTVNAVIRSIEVIGEASKKFPKSIKDKHSGIPWKKIGGMRDKLIHEYFGIDLEILWKVAKEEIKKIKPGVKQILSSLEE